MKAYLKDEITTIRFHLWHQNLISDSRSQIINMGSEAKVYFEGVFNFFGKKNIYILIFFFDF